jgi:hypothetical protein
MTKPKVIVLVDDNANTFEWMSDGWYNSAARGTQEAETLMSRARRCIEDGANVPDVIKRLRSAGFEIERN